MNKKNRDKEDLIRIYTSLSPQLKKEFILTAKLIENTQVILLKELKVNKAL